MNRIQPADHGQGGHATWSVIVVNVGMILSAAIVVLCLCGCKEEGGKGWTRLPEMEPAAQTKPKRPHPPHDAGTSRPAGMGAMMPGMMGGMDSAPSASRVGIEETSAGLLVAGLVIPIPEGWTREQPRSRMRLAQYRLPGGDDPAEMVVHCFGAGQGGSADENMARWIAQFVPESGAPAAPTTSSVERQRLRLWTVRTRGTYQSGMGGGEPKPGYALYGIIIEGGSEGTVFLKTTGPAAMIDQHKSNLEQLAAGIAVKD